MRKKIPPELLAFGPFAETIRLQKYAHKLDEGIESWEDTAYRVARCVMKSVGAAKSLTDEIAYRIALRQVIPGGRYLYAAGRPFHQTQNCFLFRAEDSREGWADLLQKSAMALMTGGGIGIDYSQIRSEGKSIRKTGGYATGPTALMQIINECGRGVMQGGSRRSAIWAGLNWKHPDVLKFITLKNWIPEVRDMKKKDFNFPAILDMTNISVLLDDEFFEAYNNEEHILHSQAHQVYWDVLRRMLKTAEPGFSIDVGVNAHETLRNACTEVTSRDDSDVCNLLSLNMARIDTLEDMQACVELAMAFGVAGSVYSDVPFAKVDSVRTKNRRIGLGLMGLHEWLLIRGKSYGPDEELENYLRIYASSGKYAKGYARDWDLSTPIKTRAIAPTGTIGIIGETTTGIEPVLCSAYKRRYLKGDSWHYQYVIEAVAKRLIEEKGVEPDAIEDAYILAEEPERRVAFQAWVQKYVDHAISSTINLPAWGSEGNNEDKVRPFGDMLIKYLPQLRGITCYPDGARSGQPLTAVKYDTAIKHIGHEFSEVVVRSENICEIVGKGGGCGE